MSILCVLLLRLLNKAESMYHEIQQPILCKIKQMFWNYRMFKIGSKLFIDNMKHQSPWICHIITSNSKLTSSTNFNESCRLRLSLSWIGNFRCSESELRLASSKHPRPATATAPALAASISLSTRSMTSPLNSLPLRLLLQILCSPQLPATLADSTCSRIPE